MVKPNLSVYQNKRVTFFGTPGTYSAKVIGIRGAVACIVKKTISFEDYKRCLFEGTRTHRSQMLFRWKKHKVRTLEVNKLALSREDDKRVSVDGIASLA